jgi:hypothetical protein
MSVGDYSGRLPVTENSRRGVGSTREDAALLALPTFVLIVYPLVNTRAASERARENRYALPRRARALSSGVSSTPLP